MKFTTVISLLTLFMLLFSACSEDETPPKGTLSEEKMATILTDIHLAESRVNRLQLKSLDSSLMIFNRLKSDSGHVVVRVANGGDTYRVFVLDDRDEQLKIKSIHGPYTSR